MKLVYFGTPEFAIPPLEALLAAPDLEVLGVVTQPDKRRGRGSQLLPSPVKHVALAHGLPVWQPPRLKRDLELHAHLQALAADVFVVVAYGQILSPQVLAIPARGCINIHGSLLPKYRGAAPIQWALYNGETETGVTTMLMDAGMDTGPILLQAAVAIALDDTTQTLGHRLSHLGADLLLQTLRQLPQLTPHPQNDQEATYARLLQKEDFCLDWGRSALELHNQVRAFYPHAFSHWQGTPLKVLQTWPLTPEVQTALPAELRPDVVPLEPAAPPGTITTLIKGWGPVVQTAAGGLLLSQVQLSGRKPQSGWDFVNGVRLTTGAQLD
ncbi:methionyl-tRNA formyltransferase [Thermosynechococcaceae cyanobacterium Okahandja]